MAKIFEVSDSILKIIIEIELNGIAAISGAKIEVIEKIDQLRAVLIEDSSIKMLSTYNHPETELGYIYDSRIYKEGEDALSEVIASYDSKF